jgi:hypothetical protein
MNIRLQINIEARAIAARLIIFSLSLLYIFSSVSFAEPSLKWQMVHTETEGDDRNSYGNPFRYYILSGRVILVVRRSGVYVSDDGENWSYEVQNVRFHKQNIFYFNGAFFNVPGNSSEVHRSENGFTWKKVKSTYISEEGPRAYGNGIFISTPQNYKIRISPDGVLWKTTWRIPLKPGESFEELGKLGAVAFCNGKFFVLRAEDRVLTSADGKVWNTGKSNIENPKSITCLNGFLIARSDNENTVLVSKDATTWKRIPSDHANFLPRGFHDIVYGMGAYYAVGERATILRAEPIDIKEIEWQE